MRTLTIVGGSIWATQTYRGAGIGSGTGYSNSAGRSIVENLTILGGNLSVGATGGAAIGSGYGQIASAVVENLTIAGGRISATVSGASGGAAIGSGFGEMGGASKVNRLTIHGGNITAVGLSGAAIGSGRGNSPVSRIDVIDGSFTLNSLYSGIGLGPSASVDSLTIRSGFFDCSAVTSKACFDAESVTFANGSAVVVSGFGTVVHSTSSGVSGSPNVYFEYLSASSAEESLKMPLLHLESISLPHPTIYRLTIRRSALDDPGEEVQQIAFNKSRSRGCAFSVGSVGNYSIRFTSELPRLQGLLHHNGDFDFSADAERDTLYLNVDYLPDATLPPTSSSTAQFTPMDSRCPWNKSIYRMVLRSARFAFLLYV
jgi:hypothetical protein